MTRYWGIRTDTEHNTTYIWRELQAGRLRQGWGRRAEEDLEVIATQLAAGAPLDEWQRQTWRGNRRLLPTERDAVHVDDVAVLAHLPRYGFWTIVRVSGSYRFSIDDGRNFLGKPDFGHVVPVEIISDPIPWRDPAISPRLIKAMSVRIRMWSLDGVAEEVEEIRRMWTPYSRTQGQDG